MALKIRRRARLRRKDVTDRLGRLANESGMTALEDGSPIDEAEAGTNRLVLRGDEPIVLLLGDQVAPTVRALLAFPAAKRWVTVDMGAVRFIYNGADVMAPGIVEADPAIRAGDIVWVRDEKNRRALAVGRAIMDGPTMAREEKGKAIQTFHNVGDDLWRLGEEEAWHHADPRGPIRRRRDATRHPRRLDPRVRRGSCRGPPRRGARFRRGAMDRHPDRSDLRAVRPVRGRGREGDRGVPEGRGGIGPRGHAPLSRNSRGRRGPPRMEARGGHEQEA